jgi:ADP-ribose pyrophosphatase YjhB (NUDIX family)
MTKETKETLSAGGVVVNSTDKVLLVNQRGTSWSLPKGHIEGGEEILEAAKREIYEESGVTQLEFIRDLGKYQRYKIGKDGSEDKSELKTIYMFLFKTLENNLQPIDKDNPEAKWVPKHQVADLLTHPKDKEFFLSVANEI